MRGCFAPGGTPTAKTSLNIVETKSYWRRADGKPAPPCAAVRAIEKSKAYDIGACLRLALVSGPQG